MRIHGHSKRCRYSPMFQSCDCGAIEDAEELELLRSRVRSALDVIDSVPSRDMVVDADVPYEALREIRRTLDPDNS